MNLNRLVARILHAIADEIEPAPPAPAATVPEPVGNDAPPEVDGSWQPNDVQHHGLEDRRRLGFR